MSAPDYPRDLAGYGANPPKAKWPKGARIALQFVLNYEEGGENAVLHGDAASEAFLSEIVGAQPVEGARHMSMESIYEYGARVGVWRLLELFKRYRARLTVFGVAMAMERDDLPWYDRRYGGRPQLVVPYTLGDGQAQSLDRPPD